MIGCRRSRNGSSTAGTPPMRVPGDGLAERIAGVPDQLAAEDLLDEPRGHREGRAEPIFADEIAPGLPGGEDHDQDQHAVRHGAPADGAQAGRR